MQRKLDDAAGVEVMSGAVDAAGGVQRVAASVIR